MEWFVSNPTWICYRCEGRCVCASCKRKRKDDADELDDHDVSLASAEHKSSATAHPASSSEKGPRKEARKEPRKETRQEASSSNDGIIFHALTQLAEESLNSDTVSPLEQRLAIQERELVRLRAMVEQTRDVLWGHLACCQQGTNQHVPRPLWSESANVPSVQVAAYENDSGLSK